MKIEKCPYCNGSPQMSTVGDWKQYFAIRCMRCGEYLAKSHEARCTQLGAILIWNKHAKEIRRQQNDSESN